MQPVDTNSESVIYNKLYVAGLVHWMPVFAKLIIHFRGLEKFIETDDEPPMVRFTKILDAATDFAVPSWRDRLIFERLAQSDLFNFRVRNESGSWNPLSESLEQFATRGRPILFYDAQQYPDRESISSWLRNHFSNNNKML